MVGDHPGELARRAGPSLIDLARAWIAVGSQSLGGGSSTLYMMRAVLVERRKWVAPDMFRECWAIGQASPGMHLVALSGMLGERMAGLPGLVVSVAAMVLPSALITVLFTAGLVEIEQHPLVQSLLRGVIPAIGGMTVAMATFFGQTSARRGRVAVVDWLVVGGTAVLIARTGVPVLFILLGAAVLGAFALRPVAARPNPPGRD
ncbi:MAG: chromate transporter [Chloroflexi bacterium]|nr:chromate transporter [Chloroflexota bacterium]